MIKRTCITRGINFALIRWNDTPPLTHPVVLIVRFTLEMLLCACAVAGEHFTQRAIECLG